MKYKLLKDGYGGKAGDVIHLSDKQVEEFGKENVLAVGEKPVENKAVTTEDVTKKAKK